MSSETVTKIVDRCRHPVTMAGAAGPASPGERTPSCGATPSVLCWVHCTCLLQSGSLTTSFTVDSTKPVPIRSP
jgi:hypothetical protein